MLSASKGVGSRLWLITKGVDFRIDSRANFYELEGNFVRVAHIDKKCQNCGCPPKPPR